MPHIHLADILSLDGIALPFYRACSGSRAGACGAERIQHFRKEGEWKSVRKYLWAASMSEATGVYKGNLLTGWVRPDERAYDASAH